MLRVREDMSVSCFDRNGLIELGDLLSLVEKYCEEGIIPLNELDEEKMLKLDFLKLAIPRKSSNDSLAWKMRQFGSEMEIPYVVRFYFKVGKDPRRAIVEYFNEIGERNSEEFLEIFCEIIKRAKGLIICGEEIVDVAMKYKKEPGALISELKGSGLISPTVGCGVLGKSKAPLYEINRFFAILLKSEG